MAYRTSQTGSSLNISELLNEKKSYIKEVSAKTGISREQLYRIARGQSEPRDENRKAILSALGVIDNTNTTQTPQSSCSELRLQVERLEAQNAHLFKMLDTLIAKLGKTSAALLSQGEPPPAQYPYGTKNPRGLFSQRGCI
jgi:transcriptional regulator with XRE-family HTH domain